MTQTYYVMETYLKESRENGKEYLFNVGLPRTYEEIMVEVSRMKTKLEEGSFKPMYARFSFKKIESTEIESLVFRA